MRMYVWILDLRVLEFPPHEKDSLSPLIQYRHVTIVLRDTYST